MGLLQPAAPGPGHVGGRGVILAAIVGLHGAAVAGLMHMNAVVPSVETAPPIRAVLLQADPVQEQRPQIEPDLSLPEIQIPPVLVPLQWSAPPPVAIQVSTRTAPQPASSSAAGDAVDADVPVQLQSIDYLQRVEPRYPPAAKRARAQGTVFLRVIIGTDGRPREVRVERSSGHELLDVAARAAVEKWLFRPYRENGVARVASVIVPIEFAITARRG